MTDDWKQLLAILLAQRLELNAIEKALISADVLTEGQVKELRKQAMNTAQAWSSREGDDALALLRVHSSPGATMAMPPRDAES